jgi:hypothetical protein
MATSTHITPSGPNGNGIDSTEEMECPLCLGKGELKRAEVLERLGMKDFARVAQLSAEEAIRLLLTKHKEDERSVWLRFETEMTKRLSEVNLRHAGTVQVIETEKTGLELRLRELEKNQKTQLQNAKDSERIETEKQLRGELSTLEGRNQELEARTKLADKQKALEIDQVRVDLGSKLRSEQSEKEDLNRRVEDYLKEVTQLREQNKKLEIEMSKVARVGKLEEVDFAKEAKTWPGIYVSEKLSQHGDYILAFRDASGAPLEPKMVVDNKDKNSFVTEGDIDKLVRDAKDRDMPVAILITRCEEQLRQQDKELRWGRKDGIWILRTTRQWFPRDLDVLKPLFERMRTEGPDFLQKNVALGEEIRRTLIDLDEIEKELKKATKAIGSAAGLVANYRVRLKSLCDDAEVPKILPGSAIIANGSGESVRA